MLFGLIEKRSFKYLKEVVVNSFADHSMRWTFVGAAFFLIIGVLTNLFLPFVLKNVVENLTTEDLQVTFLGWILISYGFIWMLSQASQHIRTFLTFKIEQRFTFLIASKVLFHLYSLSHRYFTHQKPGAIANIIRRAQRDVPNIMLGLFFYLLPTLLEFLFVMVVIIIFYPLFYVLILAFILLSFFAYTLFSIQSVIQLRERANDIDREVDGVITDWISNYEAIKTFSRHDLAIQVCNTELQKKEIAEVSFLKKYSWIQLGQSLILGLGLSVLTYCVGMGVRNKSLTVGDFILFNGYILQFIGPIGMLGHLIQDIKKALLDMKGILNILSTSSDIQEAKNPIILSGESFSVEFKNVSFSYDDRQILDKLSFRIEAGQTALIVGQTGIGKSTIAKLLLRLYDPTEGEILINNINIKHLALDSLYKKVGWVPQESYLLNDTIMNNIRFVHPNAQHNDITEVLKKSHLTSLIQKLPQGIDTIIGDRGIKLSGGEKQRLGMARLFLKNPGICIFDESTSSLDKKTETTIQENINKHLPNATKIIITHRSYLSNKVDKTIKLNHPSKY